MPFAVKCNCGKVFNVKDEFQGREVCCQVCNATFVAQPEPVAPATPPMPAAPAAPAGISAAAQSPKTSPCPFCKEHIPEASAVCPFCKERLAAQMSSEQAAAALNGMTAQLDLHVADPARLEADSAARGRFLATRTIVLGGLTIFGALLFIIGLILGEDDGGACIVFGILFFLAFIIPAIVSLCNDRKASHIQDVDDPAEAFRRYFMACKTRRYAKAFVCLAPTARNGGVAQSPVFTNIPYQPADVPIADLAGFRNYCRTIFKGPGSNGRTVQLKSIRLEGARPDGRIWIQADVAFTSVSSWWLLLVLLNLIIAVIVISVVTKREKKTIRKLLVRRNGRWYIAEAAFEGDLDKLFV